MSVRDSVTAPVNTGWAVLLTGFAGLAAALALTIERFKMFTEPGYTPSCSLNPVLSCGSVMAKSQASVFGFPNPIIGIVGFSVVVTTGVLVIAQIALPRWWWLGLFTGTALGTGFVCWLIYQSLYEIGALCPYCMLVWAIIMPLLVVSANQAFAKIPVLKPVLQWRWTIAVLWYAIIVLLAFLEFQDFWLHPSLW